jgi:hypothetical protein
MVRIKSDEPRWPESVKDWRTLVIFDSTRVFVHFMEELLFSWSIAELDDGCFSIWFGDPN